MTAAELACASCGTELRDNAKFCDECGAPVTVAATPAEYKQVTARFADVVHSMDIAAAVGAERLREIMTELVNRSSAVVQRYGGRVDKFTGDGIMAVFGAPIALEDHALRACLAALCIQEESARLASEIQRQDGVDLRPRVGLNSGQVIAGEIGSGALGYTAIGEQVSPNGWNRRRRRASIPVAARSSRATVWNGTWHVCDSQKLMNTSAPQRAAIAPTSRTRPLLPMPGGPTTPTTAPWPLRAPTNPRRPTSPTADRPDSTQHA
jgi:hypothetical protein